MRHLLIAITFFLIWQVQAQNVLLRLSNPQIVGSRVTYDVSMDNFNSMSFLSFSFAFNPEELSHYRNNNIILPSAHPVTSFDFSIPGHMGFDWFDFSLFGISYPDGTVLFNITFNILEDTFTHVCLTQTPYPYIFWAYQDDELFIIDTMYVLDPCHEEPELHLLTTSVSSFLPEDHGLQIETLATAPELRFSLENEMDLRFQLFDLSGRRVMNFPQTTYWPDVHSLVTRPDLSPGMYVLLIEMENYFFQKKIMLVH